MLRRVAVTVLIRSRTAAGAGAARILPLGCGPVYFAGRIRVSAWPVSRTDWTSTPALPAGLLAAFSETRPMRCSLPVRTGLEDGTSTTSAAGTDWRAPDYAGDRRRAENGGAAPAREGAGREGQMTTLPALGCLSGQLLRFGRLSHF